MPWNLQGLVILVEKGYMVYAFKSGTWCSMGGLSIMVSALCTHLESKLIFIM